MVIPLFNIEGGKQSIKALWDPHEHAYTYMCNHRRVCLCTYKDIYTYACTPFTQTKEKVKRNAFKSLIISIKVYFTKQKHLSQKIEKIKAIYLEGRKQKNRSAAVYTYLTHTSPWLMCLSSPSCNFQSVSRSQHFPIFKPSLFLDGCIQFYRDWGVWTALDYCFMLSHFN